MSNFTSKTVDCEEAFASLSQSVNENHELGHVLEFTDGLTCTNHKKKDVFATLKSHERAFPLIKVVLVQGSNEVDICVAAYLVKQPAEPPMAEEVKRLPYYSAFRKAPLSAILPDPEWCHYTSFPYEMWRYGLGTSEGKHSHPGETFKSQVNGFLLGWIHDAWSAIDIAIDIRNGGE